MLLLDINMPTDDQPERRREDSLLMDALHQLRDDVRAMRGMFDAELRERQGHDMIMEGRLQVLEEDLRLRRLEHEGIKQSRMGYMAAILTVVATCLGAWIERVINHVFPSR